MPENRHSFAKTERPRKRIFSLKWKTILLLSGFMISVQVGLLLLNYEQLNQQFVQQQEENFAKQERVLENLLNSSAAELQQQLPSLALLAGMPEQTTEWQPEQIRNRFDEHWFELSLGVIESVAFYAPKGGKSLRQLAAWDIAIESSEFTKHIDQVAGKLLQSNNPRPVHGLYCTRSCRQYVALPLLTNRGATYVAVASGSLADVLRDFQRIAAADIALFAAADTAAIGISNTPCCNGLKPVAMSRAQETWALLKGMENSEAGLTSLEGGQRYSLDERHFVARLASNNALSEQANVLMITDVTRPVNEIRADIRQNALIGIVALILLECILMLLLWRPMSQLRKLANALPLLAHRSYAELRSAIGRPRMAAGVGDEIDLLDEVTVELSEQLERMETELQNYTREVAQRATELGQERDFNQKLLDTAQAIILIHDSKGQLREINAYGEQSTGYSERDIRGHGLADFIHNDDRDVVRFDVQRLLDGKRERIQCEARLLKSDGVARDIIWLHARLDTDQAAVLSMGFDVTERKQAESRLIWLADHDTLTGLMNRNRFNRELETCINVAADQDRIGALLYLDLDDFKDINEAAGHKTGDEMLRRIANALINHVPEGSLVSRIGGNEFSCILMDADEEVAVLKARELASAIIQTVLIHEDKHYQVTTSIGIALFPSHSNNVRGLFACADTALIDVKKQGGRDVRVWSEKEFSGQNVEQRVYWRDRIRRALDEDRFVLFYQPIVRAEDGHLSHCEALIRMKDEDDSIIPPGQFMSVAESHGLIHEVERWVVRTGIRKLASMQAQGRDIGMSLNLSGYSFQDPEMPDVIREAINDSGVDPQGVIFEITETATVSNLTVAKEMIEQIRLLGCRFALDDFGVGFTSFHYLKKLPVDYIKLDWSYVRNVQHEPEDQVLVKAMNAMAVGLGKKVIAEGVESRACYEWLRDHHVEYIQGYYFGKPTPELPAEDFLRAP